MIGTKFNKPLSGYTDYSAAAEWCNKNGAMIIDQGSYYEVVTVPPPASPTAEQQIAEIHARLNQIDLDSVRPLRAIAAGEAAEADTDRLAALTSEASALRDELATLTESQTR